MTQEQAYNEFIPYINDTGKIYRKISPIYGRLAIENEYIETWTEKGWTKVHRVIRHKLSKGKLSEQLINLIIK